MIDWLYALLVAFDILFIAFALVLKPDGVEGPAIKMFFAVMSMPISLVLAFGSPAIEHFTTVWDATNEAWVTTDSIYTGGTYLLVFWFFVFFVGMALTAFFATGYLDWHKSQKEAHEMDF